jgi:hypothetical protein
MALVVRADLPWLAGRRVRATSAAPASSRLSATARQRKCPEVIQHGVPGGLALSPPVVRVASSTFCPSRRIPRPTSSEREVALRSSRTVTAAPSKTGSRRRQAS